MQSIDPAAELVAQNIRELASKDAFDLSAYWLAIVGSRDEYAAKLGPLLGPFGQPVLIVRRQRFDNANYLTEDLANLLENNRQTVLEVLARRDRRSRGIRVVLLGRTELPVLQCDSPVVLPEWLPNFGGRETPCFFTDITRRINIRMDDPESRSFEISRALYALESALVRRLITVSKVSPSAHLRLFDAISRRSDISWIDFLGKAKASLRGVSNTESYRPNGRRGDSIVARLWGVAQSGSQMDLVNTAAALKEALRISEGRVLDDWHEGLFSALGRSRSSGECKSDEFSRSIVHTVSASCQYITCAMHGHEYQRFPLQLITAVVSDLYGSLYQIESCLNLLSVEDLELDAHAAGSMASEVNTNS